MTLGSGAISTKSPGTTLMNVTQKIHWCPRSKTRSPNPNSESDPENNEKRKIIDVDPTATVMTATIQPEEPVDPEEGECLFHSQMWVKGTQLHFIVDSGSHKNLISAEVVKQLGLSTTPHLSLTTSGGFTRDEITVSANSVACPMASIPSRMR
jgi:hypothetical protein